MVDNAVWLVVIMYILVKDRKKYVSQAVLPQDLNIPELNGR